MLTGNKKVSNFQFQNNKLNQYCQNIDVIKQKHKATVIIR